MRYGLGNASLMSRAIIEAFKIFELAHATKNQTEQRTNRPKFDRRVVKASMSKRYQPNGAREIARRTRQVDVGSLRFENGYMGLSYQWETWQSPQTITLNGGDNATGN